MHMTRFLANSAIGTAISLAALSAPPALAQDDSATMSSDIPADYATLPSEYAHEATAMGSDEVETITRTRWIERSSVGATKPHHPHAIDHMNYGEHAHATYAPAYSYPVRFDRESWLAECNARTRDLDDGDDRKGGIIGALLGAISGGIIGNRAWDSERLLGSVVGAGVGGLAGYAIGSAVDGGGERDYRYRYDCEAALDRYMSGASYPAPHIASRSMPAHGYGYSHGYMPAAYGYGPMYASGCNCSQPMVMIEVREEIPQHVVVRENVREEWVDEPVTVRERVIEEVPVEAPPPAPTKLQPIKTSGKMIKGG